MTILQALEYVVYTDIDGNMRELEPGHILRTEEPDEARIVEQHPSSFTEPNWAWTTDKAGKDK